MKIPNLLIPIETKNMWMSLSDERAGKLVKILIAYAESKEEPTTTDDVVTILFKAIQPQIDKNIQHYAEVSEKRQEAIRKRWEKEESEENIEMNTNEYKCIEMYSNEGKSKSKSKSKNILSEREITPPTPSKGKGGDSSSLLTKAKNLFRKSYGEIEGKPYAWTKKDERAMESLIGKLQYCYPSSTDKEILSFLDRFVENSVCNQWVSENLSVSILDLKFNEINKLLNA